MNGNMTERKLAALMIADVVGSSRLMERSEAATFTRLRILRDEVFGPHVGGHGGRIIKSTGDGFLAEFPSAHAAFDSGIDIQAAVIKREAEQPDEDRIRLRIGINLGDIIIDGDDIAGDGVNVVARLEPLSPPDGLCIAASVRDQVRDEKLGVIFKDLGEQTLKNISRTVRAFAVILEGSDKPSVLAGQPLQSEQIAVDEGRFEQRLAAIFAADAVGYSRLMAADDRATVMALDAARAIFRKHIDLHDGRVIDMAGDSVLAVFGTATGAVKAALEVQNDIAGASNDIPEAQRMLFRIGVHLGEVIVKADGTVYGDGVNIAARLQSLAEPRGITVSDAVRSAVRSKVNARFVDQGEQMVKNIPESVRAFQVCDEGAPATGEKTAGVVLPLPDKPSLAVLPFANMSGDPEQEYFTDGITEDIITELSRFRSLFVIARNSTFTYKGKAVDVRAVSTELGVRYVLEGSIRRANQRVRVTAQLIDAVSGSHIWAERYDRVLEDIFEVQEEVTRAIVAAIAPQIETVEMDRARNRKPGNMNAYELGMRAWGMAQLAFRQEDRVVRDEAIRLAHEAIALDPRCGAAWRSIASAQWQHVLFGTAASVQDARNDGMQAALRAVTIDGADEMAYAYKAMFRLSDGQVNSGLADLRRAHELNPNNAMVLALLGYLEACTGNATLGVECSVRAIRLSPRDPSRYLMTNLLGWAHFTASEYREATEAAHASLSEEAGYAPPRLCLVISLVGLGEIEAAKLEYQRLVSMAPNYAKSHLNGEWTVLDASYRQRGSKFLRIAAGLEQASATATVAGQPKVG